MTAVNETSDETDRQIVATRVFDAPSDLVFRTFIDPEHVSRWWGPRGFRTTTHAMDVRPGGEWRFVMHGPDGRDYDNRVVYREVDPPRRLAYSHTTQPSFDVLVTFEEERGERTRVRVEMTFASPELRGEVAKFGAVEGLHDTLDRLGEQLANASAFVIEREFDAPRELMFEVWTRSEHLQQWFGPKGMTIFHCTNDLRPGGMMHYGMRARDGSEMWGRWIYREIVPPERLVFVISFSDPEGAMTRAPFAEEWPMEMLSTVSFTERDGKTTVMVQSAAIHATAAERRTFREGHASMRGGWSGTFEQLEAYVGGLR
jgi:uncharacterized protein YndB with AHSA1/START domain